MVCCSAHACPSYPLVVVKQRPEGRGSHAARFCLLAAQAADQHLHGFVWKRRTELEAREDIMMIGEKKQKNQQPPDRCIAPPRRRGQLLTQHGGFSEQARQHFVISACSCLTGNVVFQRQTETPRAPPAAPPVLRAVSEVSAHGVTSHPAVGRLMQERRAERFSEKCTISTFELFASPGCVSNDSFFRKMKPIFLKKCQQSTMAICRCFHGMVRSA